MFICSVAKGPVNICVKERSMKIKEAYEVYKNFEVPSLSEIRDIASEHSKTSLVIIILLVVLLLLALQYIPHYQVVQFNVTNQKDLADAENSYRATLAQIFGGVAIAVGLYYTWRRINIAEEDLKATKEGQITERFTRAVDQLGAIDKDGNPAIEIRLGGIYSLEGVANESEKNYSPIMEILTAYIRKNSPVETEETQDKVSLDIQAILTIIRRRKYFFISKESKSLEYNRLDLRRTNLRKANLEKAHLGEAIFIESDLRKANLEKTILKGANLIEANLEEADLRRANLENAHLEKANLKKASFVGGAYLGGAKLTEANLEEAYLRKANLEEAYLEKANLKKVNLEAANLEEANLEEAYLREAKLEGANFKGANLRKANLGAANLGAADLTETNLKGAKLDSAYFGKDCLGLCETTNLLYATLEGADLKGAKNLTVNQLSKAKTLYKAELDEELEAKLREKGFGYLLDNKPER